MEFVLELILQVFGEFLIQLVVELLAELGMHSVEKAVTKPRHPLWATIGFAILGMIAGGASLLIFPSSAIADPHLRQANLILTPAAAGAVMALIGRSRDRRGRNRIMTERFGYAFTFALAMAAVRFLFAR